VEVDPALRCTIAIQTIGAMLWEQSKKSLPQADKLRKKVYKKAKKLGAPRELADQLASFFADRFHHDIA